MNIIPRTKYEAAYRSAQKVYDNPALRNEALDRLEKIGIKRGSAKVFVDVFSRMRNGLEYKRTLSTDTTDDFLTWILRDYGVEGHRNAVEAFKRHVRYYLSLKRGPMQSHVSVLEKHERIAVANKSSSTAPATVGTTRPVYQDFGEAPNDDPEELRVFAAKVRRGQVKFRRNLLRIYGGRCAISGTAVDEVLEACHILLHAESGINHTGNGILLRSDLHQLFDEGLISIDPETMKVVVAARLMASEYGRFHGIALAARADGSLISKELLRKRVGMK